MSGAVVLFIVLLLVYYGILLYMASREMRAPSACCGSRQQSEVGLLGPLLRPVEGAIFSRMVAAARSSIRYPPRGASANIASRRRHTRSEGTYSGFATPCATVRRRRSTH